MTEIAKCEGCCDKEKVVTNVEGHLLCENCEEDVVRCSFCNRLLAINFDDLETNIGTPIVPELSLPDQQTGMMFCDVDCLEEYIHKYKREKDVLEKMKEIRRE